MELQTEKKAIHTALKSIRADDDNLLASLPQPPAPPTPSRTATTPSHPAVTEVNLPPIPTAANSAAYQTIIKTALKDGFPASENQTQRSAQPSPQKSTQNHASAVKSFPPVERPSPAQLEAQAQHINQLSQTQEATLHRLKAIALQIEQERREAERQRLQAEKLAQTASATPSRSTVKLSLPPATASQSAYETAHFLRQLQGRLTFEDDDSAQTVPVQKSRRRPTLLNRLRRWLSGSSPKRQTSRRPLQNRPNAVRRSSHAAIASPKSLFTLRETLTLLFGAAAIRVLLNLLLQSVPLLTIPVMILLMLPAAIALYKATTAPQFSILWGYRICIILLGLLIGGRL